MSVNAQHVELAIIIVQLQRISPALSYLRAGVAKLLLFFKLEKTDAAPAAEPER